MSHTYTGIHCKLLIKTNPFSAEKVISLTVYCLWNYIVKPAFCFYRENEASQGLKGRMGYQEKRYTCLSP